MSEHTKGLGNGVETADRKKIEGLLGQLTPFDLREAEDIACMRRYLACFDNLLTRQNTAMHLSSSSLILDESGQNTLLCWHNIYRSWSWTGGHADGDADLLAVALREAQEETGAVCRPFSQPGAAAPLAFDILPVWAHEKRGRAVAAHLHLNFTFLLQADSAAPVREKPDENSGVRWFALAQLPNVTDEREMAPVYRRLLARLERQREKGAII